MYLQVNPNVPWLCRILRITPAGENACKGLDAIVFLQFSIHGISNIPWMGRSIKVSHQKDRAVKCYQCSNPAMYQVGEQKIPLCLDCYFKYSQIVQRDLENNERMMNYLSDQIAASVGMPPMGPRFPPRPQPVHIGDVKLNNISVNNSVVGTINTGSIGSIDQSISVLNQLGEPSLADAIKGLSEAILQSGDLSRNQRNELVEILSVLAKEAATPQEARQSTVAQTLLDKAMKITSLANDITDVCQKWWPVLLAAFGVAAGG